MPHIALHQAARISYPSMPADDEIAWKEAACVGVDRPDMFFADTERGKYSSMDTKEAKEICAACPIRTDCLTYALERRLLGVWGATTTEERERMRRRR